MSTFIKSVLHARIGIAIKANPVLRGEIIEVDDDYMADKLLSRTQWSEEREQDVPVWEKSTAAAYKAQQSEKTGKRAAVEPEASEPVIPLQQQGNTNETHEDENDGKDTKETAGKQGADLGTPGLRLSSEGERDEGNTEGGEKSDEAPAKAPAAKKVAVAKPAAKPAVKAKPAVAKPAARPAKPAQRPAK